MIVPRSVNNKIFIGDSFKLRFQQIFNAKADMQRQFPSIVSDKDKPKVFPLLCIKITGQTKHTQLCSIACISPANPFKQRKENMNFPWTTIFTTKLFFWQVCVCSAKGDTPWTPFFFSFFFFFN